MHALTIVCPVDYSDCSKRALRYAGALAEHFGARLVVMHVFDSMLAAASVVHQYDLLGADEQEQLRAFVEGHVPDSVRQGRRLERVLTIGSPSAEILSQVTSRAADLLIMGTHGLSGVRKIVFGSTLQAVLVKVRIPVLAVPHLDRGEAAVDAPLISSGAVLAPVDFSAESRAAATAAAGLARAFGLKLSLLHVIDSPKAGVGWQHGAVPGDRVPALNPSVSMSDLAESLGPHLDVHAWIEHGEPAEEIARHAREKQSALIVMSLGSSAMYGRAPGSIAYKVLCLAPVPVFALPETSSGRLYIEYLHHDVKPIGA